MTWPDVLRWLALIVGGAASLAGLAWTLGPIFRPWMREAAREAADGLYERLRGNDFRHVEDAMKVLGDRIERVDAGVREDRAAMEARIGDRIERVDAGAREDRAAMEARIGAQLERMEARIVDRAREDRAAILEALATP